MGAAVSGHDPEVEEEEEEESESENEAVTVFDVYELGEQLGCGNFGEVRAAWRREDKQKKKDKYAVKIVDQHSESVKAAEAFIAAYEEINILRGLHHPNIVELVETFEDNRFLYVVMELIPGGELFKAITSPGIEVLEPDVIRMAKQMLEALLYLHKIGIVHRDIKAQNILLAEPPKLPGRALENADLKIVDFGLACKLQQDCVRSEERQLDLVCGTPAMCAPEIWSAQDTAPHAWQKLWGQAYGPKVDVWATGVVLYMMLLGQLPFNENHPTKLAQKVCDPKVVPTFKPAVKEHKVSDASVAFLQRLLEKAQADRPTAAQALKDPWLSKKTRGLSFTPIPQEVRLRAAAEAKAAAELAHEHVPVSSALERAERREALEVLKTRSARSSQAPQRSGAAARSLRVSANAASGSDSEEERAACRC